MNSPAHNPPHNPPHDPLQSHHLNLPYLAAEQAQKHVTVNETLRMLDALVHASVLASDAVAPPASPAEGARFLLGAAPQGAWEGHGGALAARQDGAWAFFAPQPGWRIWDIAASQLRVYDGARWQTLSTPAAGLWRMTEWEHVFAAGAAQSMVQGAPAGTLILGASLRVLEALAGPESWSLGVADAPARYGEGLDLAKDSTHQIGGVDFYAADTPLLATPTNGAFEAQGRVRVRLYGLALVPPPAG